MAENCLRLTRRLKASPGQIWRCWTEAELLKKWFTPKPVETTEAEVDPIPGGRFRTVIKIPGETPIKGDAGCILVAQPARRLVWTNALGPDYRPNLIKDAPMDFAFTADIRMEPDGRGCLYLATVTHARETHMKAHEDMGFHQGWGQATEQLEALAATL